MGFSGKSTKFKLVAVLLIGVAIGAALGYGVPLAIMPTGPEEPTEIKVGIIYGLTGSDARMGEVARRVFDGIAIKEINDAGGVKSLGGLKFRSIWGDHQGKPEVAMAEAERLITQDHVDVIVGTRFSACAVPIAQVCERYKIPFVAAGGSAVKLTESGFNWTFRPLANDLYFSKPHFTFLKTLKEGTGASLNTIAYVYENSLWGSGVADAWKLFNADPEIGGYTVVADIPYSAKSADVSSEVLRVKAANPDVVLMASYEADSLLFLKTFKGLDFYPKLFGVQDGFNKPEFLAGINGTNLGDYLFMATNYSPDIQKPKTKQIAEKYQTLYGEAAFSDVVGQYSAFWTLYKALEKADSLEPEKIRDALRAIEIPEEEIPMVGSVKFDSKGQNIRAGMLTLQYLNGTWHTVYPPLYASINYTYPIPTWNERP